MGTITAAAGTTRLSGYRDLVAALLLSSAACVGMLGVRIMATHRLSHAWLAWNLFLAWVPMVMTLAARAVHRPGSRPRAAAALACAAVWIATFPNAPYLVTDLIHLRPRPGAPLWYDLLLTVAFAWTGFLLGLVSLFLMHAMARRAAGPAAGWTFAILAVAAGSAGIYLGRFLRYNSWDILARPWALLRDVAAGLAEPWQHARTFVFTGAFALLFLSAYLVLCAVVRIGAAERA